MQRNYSSTQAGTTDLFEALFTQRAIRSFKSEHVPDEVLWDVLEAATKAPSGGNLQPWGFLVIRDLGKRRQLGAMLREFVEGNYQFQEMLAAAENDEDPVRRRQVVRARRLFTELEHVPVLIVPCLDQSDMPTDPGLLTGSSVYPAVQNLLLAARGHGLGTVLTTFQAMFEDKFVELFGLPENVKPVALIPLGYPEVKFGPTTRKPVDTVVHWDQWGAIKTR